MGTLDQLLELQERDTVIDQLRHRRATLPERAALDALAEELGKHDARTGELQRQHDELAKEQKRIEDEVALVETKRAEVDKTLYSGTVTSPRELQALQDELGSLQRRQRQLEDKVLELMEQIEPLVEQLEARRGERAAFEARQDELQAALREGEEQIDAELAEVEQQRSAMAGALEADVLARYDQARAEHGGIAVAPLVGNTCGGCHLALSAVELDRIRHEPPDAVIHCEECGRLLVR